MHENVTTHCGLMVFVNGLFFEIAKNPKNVANRSIFLQVNRLLSRVAPGAEGASQPPARQRRISRRRRSGVDISHPEPCWS